MASKDPRIAFKALNRTAIGTSMIGAGFAIDQAGLTGEKWYEIKSGDKQYDMRPYAPFSATFFVGRLLSRVTKEGDAALLKLKTNDWSQAFLAMRRTDLTGMPILDMLDRGNIDGFKDGIARFFGEYAAGFTVPLRTAGDVMGQFNKEDRLPRYIRDKALLGPTQANIPFWNRELPVRESPLRSSPEERQDPLLRQITGLTSREKTQSEVEADRLGLQWKDIYPRTGVKSLDNLAAKYMGPHLEDALGKLMASKTYLTVDDKVKTILFKKYVNVFRKAGQDMTFKDANPHERLELMMKHKDALLKDLLEKSAEQALGAE